MTAFGLFEICSHASPGFFMTAFPFFGICSQLIPWFCLTYLSILPYAVNSGLVQQKLSCSYIDNERFLLTRDVEIRRRSDITTQQLQIQTSYYSKCALYNRPVDFQRPAIITTALSNSHNTAPAPATIHNISHSHPPPARRDFPAESRNPHGKQESHHRIGRRTGGD